MRLLIERGVDILRATGKPGQSGPPQTSALKLSQWAARDTSDFAANKLRHPVDTVVSGGIALATIGLDVVAKGLVKVTPGAIKSIGDWAFDLNDWRDKRHAALDGGARIDKAIDEYYKSIS
jgi:hypothetical protein